MSQTAMPKAEKKAKNEVLDTIVVIIEALIIAVLFRTFLWQPFSIPTGSLQPTMLIGDYFVANKWAYGFGKYSFPLPLPLPNRILAFSEPRRGDIVVFHNEPSNEDYVKRLIGLPGDKIQVQQGRLYINGVMMERELIGPGTNTDQYGNTQAVTLYKETLPSSVTGGEPVVHTIQEVSDDMGLSDNTVVYTVPAGHYFMMGDNRDNSQDSRFLDDVGYVPATNLIGKAEARFFSIKDNIAPWQIWQWPGNVRWDRMFQSVYQVPTTTP